MDIIKRAVSFQDSDLILEWRNSVDARHASQKPQKISQYEHEVWIRSRISRIPDEPFWIMSLAEKYVGYIRLDHFGESRDTFTVSIFVVPEFQNIGIGNRMLLMALGSAATDYPHSHFRAIIKKDNFGSINLFKKLGFKHQKELDSEFTEYRLSVKEII